MKYEGFGAKPGYTRKLKMTFTIDHNSAYLIWLKRHDLRYTQATIKPGYVRYYRQGFQLTTPNQSELIEIPNKLIVLASLSKNAADLRLNPTPVRRFGKSTVIPFGLEVSYIQDGTNRYNAFPIDFNFNNLQYQDATFDLDNKTLTINAILDEEISLEESTVDYTKYYLNRISPMIEDMQKIGVLNDIDIYRDPAAQNAMYNAINSMLSNLGIVAITRQDTTRPLRERLIQLLMKQDYIVFDQQNAQPRLVTEAMLTENNLPDNFDHPLRSQIDIRSTTPTQIDNTNMTGLHLYRGAYWPTEEECLLEISLAAQLGQTEEDVIHDRKRRNRMEYFENRPLEQRLVFLTERDLDDPQMVVYAMTDDERKFYETGTPDLDDSLRATAKQRWIDSRTK